MVTVSKEQYTVESAVAVDDVVDDDDDDDDDDDTSSPECESLPLLLTKSLFVLGP